MDWSADQFKIGLLSSSYTPTVTHSTWTTVSSYEITGAGYTAGGVTATSLSVTQVDASNLVRLDMADAVFGPSCTFTANFAVLYDDTIATDDIVCIFEFTEGKSPDGGSLTLEWSVDGVITFQQS
jgi:hypothetical protein